MFAKRRDCISCFLQLCCCLLQVRAGEYIGKRKNRHWFVGSRAPGICLFLRVSFSDFLGVGGPGRGAWIARDDEKFPWFKVDFRDWREVRGIITQVCAVKFFINLFRFSKFFSTKQQFLNENSQTFK